VSLRWQISFGQLFDVLRPAVYALGVVSSTWLLADARRRRLRRYACAAWTLATLILPFTVLPLYLLARLWQRPHPAETDAHINTSETETSETAMTVNANETAANVGASAAETAVAPAADETTTASAPSFKSRLRALRSRYAPTLLYLLPPLVYLLIVTTLGTLYFIYDYRSLDAHLARASNAKLNAQHARAAAEYRAALRLRADPHTRKLLGLELAALQQWPDALAELRAADAAGEPDPALPFHLAAALAALDRKDEAHTQYQRFLAGALCTQPRPDARCAQARFQ
jgi:tetratricopeptide (TPR) repeat protein